MYIGNHVSNQGQKQRRSGESTFVPNLDVLHNGLNWELEILFIEEEESEFLERKSARQAVHTSMSVMGLRKSINATSIAGAKD